MRDDAVPHCGGGCGVSLPGRQDHQQLPEAPGALVSPLVRQPTPLGCPRRVLLPVVAQATPLVRATLANARERSPVVWLSCLASSCLLCGVRVGGFHYGVGFQFSRCLTVPLQARLGITPSSSLLAWRYPRSLPKCCGASTIPGLRKDSHLPSTLSTCSRSCLAYSLWSLCS